MKQIVSPALLPLMQSHIAKWGECRLCSLCDNRFRAVFFRGRIPCDVLFIGEAPGDSENMQGVPFVELAPSGEILNRIIEATGGNPTPPILSLGEATPASYTWAMTNAVACCSEGPPPEDSLLACSPRLLELVKLASPKLIVAVGKQADHAVTKYGVNKQTKMTVIPHPSFMLRQEDLELEIRKAVLLILEALSWI